MEELTALLTQRVEASSSPDYSAADLANLKQQIDAHVDGLLVNPDASLPLLQSGIAGEDPPQVYAAA